MSVFRARALAVLAALAFLVPALVAAPAPVAVAGGGEGGGSAAPEGQNGDGSGAAGKGRPLVCLDKFSSTVGEYERSYDFGDPRCVREDVWEISNQWVPCTVGFQVWRFYGTKENPTAHTTLSEANLRTRPIASSPDLVCAGGATSQAAQEADFDSYLWVWSPNPWDAKVSLSTKNHDASGNYEPPAGRSVWNVSDGNSKNMQLETVYGTYAFLPTPPGGIRTAAPRPTASPSGSSGSSSAAPTPFGKPCVGTGGKIKVDAGNCPVATGKPIYRSRPANVVIQDKKISVGSCLDLTAARLTGSGGPYEGKFASARQLLTGDIMELPLVRGAELAPDEVEVVRASAVKKVKEQVAGMFSKLTMQPFTLSGVQGKLTPPFARAILGMSTALDPDLRAGPSGVSADDVTSRSLLYQEGVNNGAAPCGSAMDFALYTVVATKTIVPSAATDEAGNVELTAPESRILSRAIPKVRKDLRASQVRMGFCVAPIIQYAWVTYGREGVLPGKYDKVLPNGLDDEVLLESERRYAQPSKRVDLSFLPMSTGDGQSLVTIEPVNANRNSEYDTMYNAAIAKSISTLYDDPKTRNSLPLGFWKPSGSIWQSAESLLSKGPEASKQNRIESAVKAVKCFTSYFDAGLVLDEFVDPPTSECVPGVDLECTDSVVETVDEIQGSSTPVRVELAIERGLSAQGSLSKYSASVQSVNLYCGERLCNHGTANPLDPTLEYATGLLDLEVAGTRGQEYKKCSSLRQGNCDYYVVKPSSPGPLSGQSLEVVFFSPTPDGVVIRPVLTGTKAAQMTYKKKYKVVKTCSPAPAPTPPSAGKPSGSAPKPVPAPAPICSSRTVFVGYEEAGVVDVSVSFSTPGGGNRIVSGSIGSP